MHHLLTPSLAIATEIGGRVTGDVRDAILADIQEQVSILNSTFSWKESDRVAATRAIHALADLAKNEEVVNVIVEGGAIPSSRLLRSRHDAGQDLYIRVPASKLVWVTIGVLCVPPPKKETLSRHSFLGPSCLRGQWLGPSAEIKVQYPSSTDLTHINDSSLNQAGQYDLVAIKELDQGPAASTMNSVLSLDDGRWWHPAVYPESSPIPPSKVADPRPGPAKSSQDSGPGPSTYQHLHIPVKMMEDFLRLAFKNTRKNLETCGVLAGSLKTWFSISLHLLSQSRSQLQTR
ncbi:AMSH-like ubiquitin thioesterase [Arachis hypogaea]|nr:AMSH-like ubiquitin thioesterase [Arachis hypogaea]